MLLANLKQLRTVQLSISVIINYQYGTGNNGLIIMLSSKNRSKLYEQIGTDLIAERNIGKKNSFFPYQFQSSFE